MSPCCPLPIPSAWARSLHGDHSGRFDFYDGRNFNRDYPDLSKSAAARVEGRLGPDPAANVALIRAALAEALDEAEPQGPADTLRHSLLRLALPADVVLDLHCDGEAEVHLYTQPASLDRIEPLAAFTGARALLLADESGGHPFDEALSAPLGRARPTLSRSPHSCRLRDLHGGAAGPVGRVP